MSTEQERADFEAWFTREKGYPPQIDPDHRGKYLVGSAAQLHWVGWQARAALLAEMDALRDALWVATEHNALHFGETHNTVIQGRAALAQE